MLNFIGIGSAFNTKAGNTSAFLNCGSDKILFDCGETVFASLKDSEFWTGHTNVFVTHNHPDHIGSLGTFIFYSFYLKKDRPTIYGDQNLKTILTMMGVRDEMFNFVDVNSKKIFTFKDKGALKEDYLISPVDTKHASTIQSKGYIIHEKTTGLTYYFGGDSSEVPELVFNKFNEGKINYLYIDTSWIDYPDSIHLSYKKLCDQIKTKRSHVFLMHLDEGFNETKAKADGFKIAGE